MKTEINNTPGSTQNVAGYMYAFECCLTPTNLPI